MAIMVPINIDECPAIPVFNMDEYLSKVSSYATSLWNDMTLVEERKKAKSSMDEAIEDIKAGRVYTMNSVDDFLASL